MFEIATCVLVLTIALTAVVPAHAQSGDEQDSGEQDRGELRQFQDWNLQCIQDEQQLRRCNLFHQVNAGQGQTVLTVSAIIHLESGSPLVVFTVPLGVNLIDNLTIEIRNRYYKTFEREVVFTHCNAGGCHALTAVDSTLLKVLVEGRALTARFHSALGQSVAVEAPLYGFTDGFNALKKVSAQ